MVDIADCRLNGRDAWADEIPLKFRSFRKLDSHYKIVYFPLNDKKYKFNNRKIILMMFFKANHSETFCAKVHAFSL